jgi:hypothetical protein
MIINNEVMESWQVLKSASSPSKYYSGSCIIHSNTTVFAA